MVALNKHEFEIKQAVVGAQKLEVWISFGKYLATLATVLYALKIIFDGLQPFIGQNPEALLAFAKIINAINPSNITSYIVAGIATIGWKLERKGKQRAIRQKDEYQKQVESGDAYRSSSGLTKTGQTPKGAEK